VAQHHVEEEYDPEVENIDDLIIDPFSNVDEDYNPAQHAKPVKGSRAGFATITKQELEEMEDDDEIIDLFLQNPDRFTLCKYYKKGNCRYGDNCRYLHPEDYTQHELDNIDRYYIDEECCICLEKVLRAGRQFGILDNCDHTFCLKCIRDWRSTYDKKTTKHHYRTCPICRRNSFIVIPSDHLVKSGPEKTYLIEDYKEALKNIPCRHFNKG